MVQKTAYKYYQRGIEHYQGRKWSYAINAFRKALDHDPVFSEARALFIKSLIQADRLETARREIRKHRGRYLSDNTVYILRGYLKEKEGNYDEAMSFWNSADLKDEPQVRFDRGELHLKLRNYDEALTDFQSVLEDEELRGMALLRTGEVLLLQGRFGDAIGYLRRSAKLLPWNSDVYLRSSQAYYHLGQIKKAYGVIKQAILVNNTQPENFLQLAQIQKGMGEIDAAAGNLKLVTRKFPDYLPAYIFLANMYLETGRLKEAENELKGALRRCPNDPDCLYLMGTVCSAQGDWDRSLNVWEKIRYIQPDFTESYFHLGNLYSLKGEIEEAITHYEIFLELAPEPTPEKEEAYISLGYLYLEEGMVDDLETLLNRAIGEFPEVLSLRLICAQMYNLKGDPDRAEAELSYLLEKHPNDPETLYELGLCYTKQQRYGDCLDVWKRALNIDRDNFFLSNEIAELLLRCGDFEEAVRFYNRTLTKSPQDTMALSGLAVIYMGQGDYTRSILYWNHILELDGASVPAHIALVEIYLIQGEMEKAREYLHRFERKFPNHAYLYFLKGLFCLVQGDNEGGLKNWRRGWGRNARVLWENATFLKDFLKKWDSGDFFRKLKASPFEKRFKQELIRIIKDDPELPLFPGQE